MNPLSHDQFETITDPREVRRNGGTKLHTPAGHRMLGGQLGGMEHQSANTEFIAKEMVMVAVTIIHVTDNGVAKVGHMSPKLVPATAFGP